MSIKLRRQSWLIIFIFFISFIIHINAFLRMAINKAITRPSHELMYSDHRESSVFVNWAKQVCLQTRRRWWQWCDTSDISWNKVSYRWSIRKRAITKCCLTIEKRHGVWACVWWLFLQHVCYIWWCLTAVAVAAQTSYFCMYFLDLQETNEVILNVWLY